MKKKIKLSFEALKVNSFVTSLHTTEAHGIKGGATDVTGCTTEPVICQFTEGTECQLTRTQFCTQTRPSICRTQNPLDCGTTQPSICNITANC